MGRTRAVKQRKAAFVPSRHDDAINAIRGQANRLGLPLRFTTDLDHDERLIRARPEGAVFGWAIGSDGTYLAFAVGNDSSKDRHTYFRAVRDTFTHDTIHYYIWEDGTLSEIQPWIADHAAELDERLDLAARYPALARMRAEGALYVRLIGSHAIYWRQSKSDPHLWATRTVRRDDAEPFGDWILSADGNLPSDAEGI